jgi:ClpP class serine protease
VAADGYNVIRDAQVTEDGTVIPRCDDHGQNLLAMMDEPFVNVIPIDGPITRNGDACSYGSKDIRDWMMEAAANKFCRAHVLVVNTPGGSAWAKNDFQQAIDFANERGQRVYMLVDGLCDSAGMYLASFCDEVYVVNLKDQLGCVGVMASFFTLKNGEKNQFDSETYHEYYATKSINKNKEYRDIAENDDATLLIAELDKLEDEFRKDMQAAFPNATDEHLDGKIFYAEEVMGILCDGQMLLGDLVDRAFAVANGEEEPIARTANRKIAKPEDTPEEEDDPMAAALKNLDAAAKGVAVAADKKNVSPNNNTTMTNKKYQKIAQLLGVDELVVTEEGTFLNTPLLDTLSEKLEAMEAPVNTEAPVDTEGTEKTEGTEVPTVENPATEAPATEETEAPATEEEPAAEEPATEGTEGTEAPVDTEGTEKTEGTETPVDTEGTEAPAAEAGADEKDQEIANLKTDKDTLNGLIAKHEATIEEMRSFVAQRDKTIDESAHIIAEKDNALTDAQTKIAELKAANEKLTKQVSELKAEVKELSEKPTPMVTAESGIPKDNATGEAPKVNKHQRIKRGMEYKEILAVGKE